MKVVLAGGSGLIGRALSRALLDEGANVVVLSRSPSAVTERLPAGVEVEPWNPSAPTGRWSARLSRADAVFNLAGESVGVWPWTDGRKHELRASRLGPTHALVAAIRALPSRQRPTVLLSASGTDLYEGKDDAPADENVEPAETFLARLCGDWEAAAWEAEVLGVRVVLLRFSLVVAPQAPALERLTLPFRFFLGGPIASGRQWVSWVDLADAVGIAVSALHLRELSGPLNVAAPDPRPQAEFAALLGRSLRRPALVRTPAWLVRLVLGDQAVLTLGSRRVWPAKALAAGYRFIRPRLEDSLAAALGGG